MVAMCPCPRCGYGKEVKVERIKGVTEEELGRIKLDTETGCVENDTR